VSIVFGRRLTKTTPGRFHTKIFNKGVEPSHPSALRASNVKRYFKQRRALRTETTVNHTRDFRIGRRLTQANWETLVNIATKVNEPFLDYQLDEPVLDYQLEACQRAPDATTLQRVVLPSIEDGQLWPYRLVRRPARNPIANAPIAATGTGFSFACCRAWAVAVAALSGEAAWALPHSCRVLWETVALVSAIFCLACALTSAFCASASTVSPSRSRVSSISR
jgi:hypothetical protein